MNIEAEVSTDAQKTDAQAVRQGASPHLPQPDARALLLKLQEISPTFRDYQPLALRIDKAVLERFPEFDRKVVRSAMRMHTATTRYLKSMEKGTHRFDLDGNQEGEVTAEHRAFAAQTLRERFVDAARRKRERHKQEVARQREQEAEQRKSEKLRQLVGKFGKGAGRG